MKIPLYLIFEIISFLASLICFFQKGGFSYIKLFSPFLFLSILIEVSGIILVQHRINSSFLFYPFSAIEFIFYLFVLLNIIYNPNAKRVIFGLLCVYPVLAAINIYIIQARTFPSISYALGCLLIVGLCIYYFFELFQIPRSVNLAREPSFWICSGLLFFYCCSFPLFGLANYLFKLSNIIRQNLAFILSLMNVLLYTLFTIAFLCRLRLWKTKSIK